MLGLLDRRLVVVTGKGGVGKTTVAAALGLLAAREGKRVVLCEVSGQARLPALFGLRRRDAAERRLAPGLTTVSIDPGGARDEWLRRELRSATVAGILGRARIFQLLTAAAPGLAELVTIGKVWDLAGRGRLDAGAAYDLAILDGPATGQGLALLTAPRTYATVARVGPIHRQALGIDAFLRDRTRTAVLGVAWPEEMPVNETLDLEARLNDEGLAIDAVVVNGLHPERFSRADVTAMRALASELPRQLQAAVRLALSEHERARAQGSEVRRLRQGLAAPVSSLPFLFEPEVGPDELDLLSRELAGPS